MRMKKTRELLGKKQFLLGAMALVFVILLGIFADGFSVVSYAAGKGKVTAANGAKVRKEAAVSSEMVASAAKDKEVVINSSVQGSDGYTWYQVTVDGVNGYIRSDLLQVTDESGISGGSSSGSSSSSSSGSTTETPAEVSAVNPASATVTGGQSVRIRSNASTTSQIVTTASSGLALTVTGQATGTDGKTWYQVNFISNGSTVEGFIRSDYVNLSEELTPYTEEPEQPAEEPAAEPESTPEPETKKAYETVLQDGEWYLVVTETNEGYVIQDIFDKMASNVTEYEKLEKKVKSEKVVIIILVILLVGAAAGAALLFFKMKDISDAEYFNEVERETLRRREASRPAGQKVMHTVGADKQRPAGTRPAGAPQGQKPAGVRPAGAPQGQKPAGARPAGAPQGQRPAGARPAGASQGQRPAGTRPAGAPQGQRPAGARPAGTPQGQPPVGERPEQPAAGKPKPQPKQGNTQPGWQAKNFMADDDDEFEFEFLNYDGDEEQ